MTLTSRWSTIRKSSKIAAFVAVVFLFLNLLYPLNPSPVQAVEGYGPNLTVNYLSGVTAWGDNTVATIGDTVEFYIEIHNTNVPSTAENLTVRVDLPAIPSGGVITSTANGSTTSETTVSGSQTNLSDSTSVISLPANALLQYKTGSLKITADLNGDGVKEYDEHTWPNDSLTTSSINLGSLEGGNPAVIQLSFKADVLAAIDPNLTIKFLSANPKRPSDGWSDNIGANPGDPLQFYIEIHNTNVPSVAKDLKVRVDFDNLIAYAAGAPYTSSVSDATKVSFSSAAERTFRSGSLKITWDKNGDGVKEYESYVWPGGDNIVGDGLVLGDLWGCNPFVIQLSFWADSALHPTPPPPTAPKLALEKKIVWQGNEYDSIDRATHLFDPDEAVEYKIYVKNTGGSDATGVKVTDSLPAYIRTLDGQDKKEFSVGTLAAGKEWSDKYTAKVLSNLPQNDRTQENRAEVTADNAGSDEDSAFIWINGPEILAAKAQAAAVAAAPEVPAELPATGPAVPVVLGLAGMLPVGVLLRRMSARKFLKFLK